MKLTKINKARGHRIFHSMEVIQHLEEPRRYAFIDYYIFRERHDFIQVFGMFYVSSTSTTKLDCRIVSVDVLVKQHSTPTRVRLILHHVNRFMLNTSIRYAVVYRSMVIITTGYR